MRLSLLVALDRKHLIGRKGGLPWHLPADLRRFKAITMGKAVVMGRRTHESIGKPLPGRRNIVLTRRRDYTSSGCEIFGSLYLALGELQGDEEVMIIGGGSVYMQALPLCTRIYLTEVDAELEGDVYFPGLVADDWHEVFAEHHPADSEHQFGCWFKVFDRIKVAGASQTN